MSVFSVCFWRVSGFAVGVGFLLLILDVLVSFARCSRFLSD